MTKKLFSKINDKALPPSDVTNVYIKDGQTFIELLDPVTREVKKTIKAEKMDIREAIEYAHNIISYQTAA